MKTVITIIFVFLLSLLIAGCAGSGDSLQNKEQALKDLGRSYIYANDGTDQANRQVNLRTGLEYLIKAVELSPEDADLHHDLGRVYYSLGEYQLSIQHFKKALTLNPKLSDALNDLGFVYAQLERWDDAISCFEMATQDILYKTPHMAYNNIGTVYKKKGDPLKAIEYYQRALQLAPNYIDAYFNLATTYESLGRRAEALEAYRKVIELNPQDWIAHYNIGKLYFKLKRAEEGANELQSIIASNPKSPLAEKAKELLDMMR